MLSAGLSRMLAKHIIIFCCPDLRLKNSLMLSLCLLLIYISHFLKDVGFLTISRHAYHKLICKEQLFEAIQGRCHHLVQLVIRSWFKLLSL